ncbi:MAG: hypothetical protein DRJ67_04345, partial [Thermoprotei archaeon]
MKILCVNSGSSTIKYKLFEMPSEELSILAPLHNPANLAGIRGAMKAFKDAVHVAVFDTAFHAT